MSCEPFRRRCFLPGEGWQSPKGPRPVHPGECFLHDLDGNNAQLLSFGVRLEALLPFPTAECHRDAFEARASLDRPGDFGNLQRLPRRLLRAGRVFLHESSVRSLRPAAAASARLADVARAAPALEAGTSSECT